MPSKPFRQFSDPCVLQREVDTKHHVFICVDTFPLVCARLPSEPFWLKQVKPRSFGSFGSFGGPVFSNERCPPRASEGFHRQLWMPTRRLWVCLCTASPGSMVSLWPSLQGQTYGLCRCFLILPLLLTLGPLLANMSCGKLVDSLLWVWSSSRVSTLKALTASTLRPPAISFGLVGFAPLAARIVPCLIFGARARLALLLVAITGVTTTCVFALFVIFSVLLPATFSLIALGLPRIGLLSRIALVSNLIGGPCSLV